MIYFFLKHFKNQILKQHGKQWKVVQSVNKYDRNKLINAI